MQWFQVALQLLWRAHTASARHDDLLLLLLLPLLLLLQGSSGHGDTLKELVDNITGKNKKKHDKEDK
jgi:hypothetical protein